MPLLALPLALAALVALPALAVIYTLRTRYHRRTVSTLMLWSAVAQATGGGRKKNRLQTPWVLLLELLALLLLILAATMPRWLATGQRAAVMVVLDDSWSMQALRRDGRSAQEAGADAVRDELAGLGRYTAGFVLAGVQPVRLGAAARNTTELTHTLSAWNAQSHTADLAGAIALAQETGGAGVRVLVVTDQPWGISKNETSDATSDATEDTTQEETEEATANTAPVSLPDKRLQKELQEVRWRSVGEPADNAAVVRAVRSFKTGRDVVMIEVSRLGLGVSSATDSARTAELRIEAQHDSADGTPPTWTVLTRQRIGLKPGQTQRVWFKDDTHAATGRLLRIHIEMPDDALAADNTAWLAAEDAAPVRVAILLADKNLNAAVTDAINATGRATVVNRADDAELVFTSETSASPAAPMKPIAQPGQWAVRFMQPANDQNTPSFLGPCLMNSEHPVTAGVSLDGVVWSASSTPETHDQTMAGADAIIASAGDVPLVGWWGGDAAELRINIDPARSTLMRGAAWPVLIHNVVQARASARPGVSAVNVPPGVAITLRAGALKTLGQDAPNHSADQASDNAVEESAATIQRIAGLGVDTNTSAPPFKQNLHNATATWAPAHSGVYRVELPHCSPQNVVVAWANATESDLSNASTGTHGDLNANLLSRPEYRSLGWLLGLMALSFLGLEAWLLRPERHTATPVEAAA